MTYEQIHEQWKQMVMQDTTLEQLKALRDYQEARAALCGLGDRKAIAEARTRCEALGIDLLSFTSHPICIMDLDDMIAAMQ